MCFCFFFPLSREKYAFIRNLRTNKTYVSQIILRPTFFFFLDFQRELIGMISYRNG